MKLIPLRTVLLPFALVSACAPLARGQAQPAVSALPTIQVSGDAEIRVAPDQVEISLGIEIIGKELLPTQEEQSKRVSAVIACLRKAGVGDKDIQTDHVGIRPVYDEESSKIKPDGYEVSRSIHCTLRDLGKFDEVLTAALQAGATDVNRFSFGSTEMRRHRDAARIAALIAAREKATLLANQLGMKVGRAQSVVEDQPGGAGRNFDFGIGRNSIDSISAGRADGGLAAGQIGISAEIHVTFALE